MVKTESVENLVNKLRAGKVIAKEMVIADLIKNNEDADPVATSTIVSLGASCERYSGPQWAQKTPARLPRKGHHRRPRDRGPRPRTTARTPRRTRRRPISPTSARARRKGITDIREIEECLHNTIPAIVALSDRQVSQLLEDQTYRCMLYCAGMDHMTGFTRDTGHRHEPLWPQEQVRINQASGHHYESHSDSQLPQEDPEKTPRVCQKKGITDVGEIEDLILGLPQEEPREGQDVGPSPQLPRVPGKTSQCQLRPPSDGAV